MIDMEIHSPVDEIFDPLFKEKSIRVFVKRDDLIHPLISGNKWRKLKFLLRKARKENRNHLITFGGAYSNHLVATACAGAKFGFQTTGIVRGEEIVNHSLMVCKLFGMELRFTDRESYRDKKKIFDSLYSGDPNALFVEEGGAGTEAVTGCSEIIAELNQEFNYIFCAAGTGTTAAGILKGLHLNRNNTQLNVVPVLKNGSFIKEDIKRYSGTTENLYLHCGYHFGGYGKTTPELFAFIKSFASTTGILLDHIYTAKMAFCAFDLAAQDYFEKGSKVLLIHTGGLIGLLSQAEKIDG